METANKYNVEIIEFTDPACTWCWGSEPILRKWQYRFNKQLKISFVMGGLVKNWLKSLIDNMKLTETPMGNGFNYQISKRNQMCNEYTGICEI